MRFPAALSRLNRPLSAAIVLSLAAHLLALFGHRIDLALEPDVVRLEATLARSAPDKQAGQAAKPDKPPQKAVPKPQPEEAPQPPVAEAKMPPVETPPPQPEPEQKAAEAPQSELPPPPPEAPVVVGNAWPRVGVIRYYLFGGESRDPAGASTAELHWEISPEGRYSMKLASQDAMPFPSMPWFKISFSYSSVGQMIDGQFRPERYEEEVSVFQNIVVNFDWEKQRVDFAGHSLPLAPGTLDYLTVMMQSGDPGFIERGVMAVATARGLRQYRFESLGEGDLALPFGMTWKTKQLQGKTGNNDVRVWVATEKFNLPVQIKFVVNKVNYYLVANEIKVSREALARPVPAQAVESPGATVTAPAAPTPSERPGAALAAPANPAPERQN